MRTNFVNTEKDFSIYSDILESLSVHFNKKLNILDYGANWGYSCYQFKQMDFVETAYGYELSLPWRSYGEENLNIHYIREASEVKGKIDILFSNHVIEHMINPSFLKTYADTVLRGAG